MWNGTGPRRDASGRHRAEGAMDVEGTQMPGDPGRRGDREEGASGAGGASSFRAATQRTSAPSGATGINDAPKRPIWLIAAALLAGGLVWSCTGSVAAMDLATSQATRAASSEADATQAALATTAFGLDLLATDTYSSGNVVLSPASIALALAMARAGARGDTATQMDAVLHSAAESAAGNGMNSLEQSLVGLSGTVKVEGQDQQLTLRIADAPFAQRGYELEPAYLDALASKFGAGLRLVDFSGDPEGAV